MVQTAGVPPNQGRMYRPMSGWTGLPSIWGGYLGGGQGVTVGIGSDRSIMTHHSYRVHEHADSLVEANDVAVSRRGASDGVGVAASEEADPVSSVAERRGRVGLRTDVVALHEVADVRVGAFRFAGSLRQFRTFVAFAIERADQIAVLQPAVVGQRRRRKRHQGGAAHKCCCVSTGFHHCSIAKKQRAPKWRAPSLKHGLPRCFAGP